MDENIERITKWSKGELTPPYSVELHPTWNCNLRCIFCNAWRSDEITNENIHNFMCPPRKDGVKKKRWLEITKEICEMGVKELEITGGGEPLTVSDTTLPIMELIKSYNVMGKLATNGTLWNEEHIKKTVEINWDHLTFGLEASDAKTHDFLRGKKGAFKKLLRNVKLFNYYKKLMKKETPLLTFQVVLCIKNYTKILEIIKLASELQVYSIRLNFIFDKNPTATKLKLNDSQIKMFKELIRDAKHLANSLNIDFQFPDSLEQKTPFSIPRPFDLNCYEPWYRAKIDSDGCVGPCRGFISNENINRKSFTKIWYSDTFNNFRQKIKSGNLPNVCTNCIHSTVFKK